MSAVAKRYAPALLAAAREQDVLDALEADLRGLRELLDTSEAFSDFVAHPLLSEEQRRATLDKLFGKKAAPITRNFFSLLVERDRLADLPDIVEEALDRLREEHGILPVEVVSAEKLLVRQQKDLEKKLGERTGKTIQLTCEVDESLIGGFRIKMGDVVEDYSLAAKLETFKQNVINA